MSLARADRALGGLVHGRLLDVKVASRNASKRASEVAVIGSKGSETTPAAEIRRRLGLRSTWFTIRVR
jgi:peptidoglycan hydrolase-like amidase